ncbi:MAG: nicotinate-nucleotide--dimethylbenzimidazole phosphoribosyltransferase [Candidatus Omnitrophica bacterium]|nr:nicotinate-nucleotide--dimethylbenzimidazole phosphoribosyltransferase [Candidatus Omnitrophota bacterium]
MKKINQVTKKIRALDEKLLKKTQARLDSLTKPLGSLGRLEELAKQISGITGKENPILKNKVIFTLAADHGVTEEGISAYPKEVTAQMVYNFLNGGAGINVLAKHAKARVVVVDIGVASKLRPSSKLVIKKINYGTKNMSKGPAMTRAEAIKAIETGIKIFESEFRKSIDIIGTGEMGIGNTTAASAITASIIQKPVEEITGRGAGLNDEGLNNKIRIIKKSLAINDPDYNDPIDILSKVGGFEIGGLAGIILAAASRKVPIVIDGFISGSAALLAYKIEPKTKDYMIASHCSVEKGHKVILEYIGIKPLLDLNLRLGEGTGAALGINIAEAATKILTEMATFKSAKVSERIEK